MTHWDLRFVSAPAFLAVAYVGAWPLLGALQAEPTAPGSIERLMAVSAKPPAGVGKPGESGDLEHATEPGFRTLSGEPVRELYTAADLPAGAGGGGPEDPIGRPGSYPFTRGIYESMYRGRLWTMRQFAGFGTSEETNERFRYLLDHGQTGLSTAFDMPSLMGHDSDHARSLGEVGREGVAVDTLDDMQTLFSGIDLGEVSVSMTINARPRTTMASMRSWHYSSHQRAYLPPSQVQSG